jgi:hypothetical protein
VTLLKIYALFYFFLLAALDGWTDTSFLSHAYFTFGYSETDTRTERERERETETETERKGARERKRECECRHLLFLHRPVIAYCPELKRHGYHAGPRNLGRLR